MGIPTSSGLRVSVLDQTPVSEGSTGSQALRNTIDLARLADDLGFHRYWVAEHHGGGMVAGPAPEVLIGPIASATSRMRIGSGGVMLPHYSPLKVAESFSLLAGLFPGRIDLGVGRAAGTDAMTTFALQRDRRQAAPDDFPDQLAELLALLEGRVPPEHAFARLPAALPGLPEAPVPWLLGSSAQSAIWASDEGLPYAFADFINPRGASNAALYHERFQPSQRLDVPELAVAAWAIAADSREEAERLATSAKMSFTLLRRGRLIPIPPIEKAQRFLAEEERAGRPLPERRSILGTGEEVRDALVALAREYGAQEVVVVSITHDHDARRRSYELIADAFGLRRATPARAAA